MHKLEAVMRLFSWFKNTSDENNILPGDLSSENLKGISKCEHISALYKERERLYTLENQIFYSSSHMRNEQASDKFSRQERFRRKVARFSGKSALSYSEWDQRLKAVNKRIDDLEYSPGLVKNISGWLKSHIKLISSTVAAVTVSAVVVKSSEEIIYEHLVSDDVQRAARLLELDSPDYQRPEVILYGYPANAHNRSPYSLLGRLTYHNLNPDYDVSTRISGGSPMFLQKIHEATEEGQISIGFAQEDIFLNGQQNGDFGNVKKISHTGISDCAQFIVHPEELARVQSAGSLKSYFENESEAGNPVRILTANFKFGSPQSLEILFGKEFSSFDIEIIAQAQSQESLTQSFLDASGDFDLAFYMESPDPVVEPGVLGIDNPLPRDMFGSISGLFNYSGQLGMAKDINNYEMGIVSFGKEDFNNLAKASGLPYSLHGVSFDEDVPVVDYSETSDAKKDHVTLFCTNTNIYMSNPAAYDLTSDQMEARALLEGVRNIPYESSMSLFKQKNGQQGQGDAENNPTDPEQAFSEASHAEKHMQPEI